MRVQPLPSAPFALVPVPFPKRDTVTGNGGSSPPEGTTKRKPVMKRRSAVIRDLRTPKYRPRVIKDKRKVNKRLTKKDLVKE